MERGASGLLTRVRVSAAPFALMKNPLIIGFGNPLREDDGLGWRAAELIERANDEIDIDVIKCQQLTPELAEAIGEASLVIFLDASVDQAPGTVSSRRIEEQVPTAWSHHLSPAQLIALVEEMNWTAPPAHMITGGVDHIGWNEGMTATAENCAVEMAEAAARLLRAS